MIHIIFSEIINNKNDAIDNDNTYRVSAAILTAVVPTSSWWTIKLMMTAWYSASSAAATGSGLASFCLAWHTPPERKIQKML